MIPEDKREQKSDEWIKADRFSRRAYLATLGVVGSTALAGCGGDGGDGSDGGGSDGGGSDGGGSDGGDGGSDGGGGDGSYHIGVSNFTSENPLEVIMTRSAEWWGEDRGHTVTTTAADGTTSQQLSDLRNLLQQGVDAILMTTFDSQGIAQIVDEADVPVFTCDIPTYHKDVHLHTAISQTDFGYTTGQELVNTMREQHDADTYKILEILMDQDNSNAVMRHRSFNEAIDEHDDVEVVKEIEIDGFSATNVQQQGSSWLQTDPEFHGIGAPWFGGVIGMVQAMRQRDMLHPAGEDGHISIVNMDAIPTVVDWVKEGFVDKIVDQPIRWYSVISMKYLIDFMDAGQDESVLPEIGTTIEASDLNLAEGTQEHLGHPIFDPPEPRWAPAEVVEFETFGGENLGFPMIRCSIPVLTRENADNWWHDANLARNL